MADTRELIVLAAPRTGDSYYSDVADDIRRFHIAFARKVLAADRVLILTDAAGYETYAEELGAENVAVAPMQDIWMRDFGLSNASAPVMFRYTAAGQGGERNAQAAADDVQEELAVLLEEAGLEFQDSDWLNDGGNWVDDYAGQIIVSRKFLSDNRLDEEAGRAALLALPGVEQVAFIEADEQGGLEHADGVAAFIAPNVVVVNAYPDDPEYAAELEADLKAGLPGVTVHRIVAPYDGSEIYDERFGSACGLYTNMLVTPERIYLPQFGIPEDAQAIGELSQWTDKAIVPVDSETVCMMGGGVRCMSWQVRGANADRLMAWARAQR